MKRRIIGILAITAICALILFIAFSPYIFRDSITPAAAKTYNWQKIEGSPDTFEIELKAGDVVQAYQEGADAIRSCLRENSSTGVESVATVMKIRMKIKK